MPVSKWKQLLFLSGFFFVPWLGFAQASSSADSLLAVPDFPFVGHLIDNREFEDAIMVLQAMRYGQSLGREKTDSLHFFLGRAWYLQEKIDSANKYFSKLSSSSPMSAEASCYLSFGKMYLGRFAEADSMLASSGSKDSSRAEFVNFMQASNALLQKDTFKYRQLASKFRFGQPACEWEQKQLDIRLKEIRSNNRKSPFLAGLFSAIVPGSGKYYAGYRGQAIASLVPCLIFGAASVESYYRAGPKSLPFITSGCLFGLFYLGNIWGSSFSVKTLYEQRDREIRHRLLLDVQIPMHRLFGQ